MPEDVLGQQKLEPNLDIKLNLWIIFGMDGVRRLNPGTLLSIPHMGCQAILSIGKS